MASLTQPISNMINQILGYVPGIFGAGVLLTIAWILGRLVSGIITQVLAGVGFDNLFQRLGMSTNRGVGGRPLSQIVGDIVLIAIMLFATIEAFAFLRFDALVTILGAFIALAARVLLGLVIFALGIWLANLASDAVMSSGMSQSRLLAMVARAAILVFAAAMALSQTGLAQEIVNSAFILLLGGIAVAVALAFGLGGRDTAARILEDTRRSLQEPEIPPTLPPPATSSPTVRTDPTRPA
jgi:hypothetical protein